VRDARMYCWNKSVPALRAIGLGVPAFSFAVSVVRSVSVSEKVDDGCVDSARTRDSMAATGMVKSGSDRRREL